MPSSVGRTPQRADTEPCRPNGLMSLTARNISAMDSATPHDPEQQALTGKLVMSAEELSDILGARVLVGEQAYAECAQLDPDELGLVVYDNLAAILRRLARIGPDRPEVPRAAGRMKAEAGLPLAAMLHGYRLGGRVIWERLVDTADEHVRAVLPQLATDVWTIIDEYSGLASETYGQHTIELANRDGEARSRLLGCLLSSTAGDVALWESLRVLQLPDPGWFLVVVIEIAPGRTEMPVGVEGRLRARGVHSVWTRRAGCRARVAEPALGAARADRPEVARGPGGGPGRSQPRLHLGTRRAERAA